MTLLTKKAQVAFTLQMLISIGMLFIVCAAVAGIIWYNLRVPILSHSAEAALFVEYLLLSPEGISFVDISTGRVNPSLIVEEKLDEFEKKYSSFATNGLGAKITITDINDKAWYANKPYVMRRLPSLEAQVTRQKETKKLTEKKFSDPENIDGLFVYQIPITLIEKQNAQDSPEIRTQSVLEIVIVMPNEK